MTWCAVHANPWRDTLKGSEAKAEEWKLVKVQHCAATVVARMRESQDARLNDHLQHVIPMTSVAACCHTLLAIKEVQVMTYVT